MKQEHLDIMAKILGVILLLMIGGAVLLITTAPETETHNQNYQSENNDATSDTSGYATKNYGTSATRCSEIKATCNDILGEYARFKLLEDDYTKQGMKTDYDQVIRNFEENLFPKCKEQLAECK